MSNHHDVNSFFVSKTTLIQSRRVLTAVFAGLVLAAAQGCTEPTSVPADPAGGGSSQATSDAARSKVSKPSTSVSSWFGPNLTSDLRIPPRKRFIFAGGQERGFEARVFNSGTVTVTVRGDLDGVVRDVAVLAPGEKAVAKFAAREAATFENPADVDARSKVEVWGEASVGMRYVDLPIDKPAE